MQAVSCDALCDLQRSVKWVGRLDGHHVGTTPLDFAAFFVRKGQVRKDIMMQAMWMCWAKESLVSWGVGNAPASDPDVSMKL
jgi:hypothetical protein